MNHFKFKSLAFYGVAIGSVVILFKVVTAYGETLKAPPPIEGSYRLISQTLPPCLQSSDLLLNIQQSGVYLSASLLALDRDSNPEKKSSSHHNFEEKHSLNGRWIDGKVALSGTVNKLATCEKKLNVKIQALVNQETISGEMTLDLTPRTVKFTSQKEAKPSEETKATH